MHSIVVKFGTEICPYSSNMRCGVQYSNTIVRGVPRVVTHANLVHIFTKSPPNFDAFQSMPHRVLFPTKGTAPSSHVTIPCLGKYHVLNAMYILYAMFNFF